MAFFSVASWPVAAGKQSATAFLQIDFTATVLLVGGHSQSKNPAREGKLGQNGGFNPGSFFQMGVYSHEDQMEPTTYSQEELVGQKLVKKT